MPHIWPSYPILSHSLHPTAPDCTWTCSMKYPSSNYPIPSSPVTVHRDCSTWFKLFFWLSYPTLIIRLQNRGVCELAQLFEYPSSDFTISSSPGHCTWTWTWSIQVVWILLFWFSYPTLFIRIRLQDVVRQLDQLLKYRSSDHPIPLASSSLSVSRLYVNLLNEIPLIWLSHPILSSTPWLYVIQVVSLIILSYPHYPSPEQGCTWTSSIVWIPLI